MIESSFLFFNVQNTNDTFINNTYIINNFTVSDTKQ